MRERDRERVHAASPVVEGRVLGEGWAVVVVQHAHAQLGWHDVGVGPAAHEELPHQDAQRVHCSGAGTSRQPGG